MTCQRISTCLIAVFLLTGNACSSAVSAPQTTAEVAGSYSLETGLRRTILLNTDGTFVYEYGSSTTSKRTRGEWRLIAPNLILAKISNQQEYSKLLGRSDPSWNHISVTVVDLDGVRLPTVDVTVECQNEEDRMGVSGPNGMAVFEWCNVVKVSAHLDGFKYSEAKPLEPNQNLFTVTLRPPTWFPVPDQLWYVHEGQLFELGQPLAKKTIRDEIGDD